MNPIYELNITWEVTWTPGDSDEERKEYTDTLRLGLVNVNRFCKQIS